MISKACMRAEYHRASLLYYSLYYNKIACKRLHPLSHCSPHLQEHVCSIFYKLQPAQSVMLQLIPPSISYYHSSYLSATIEFHYHLSYFIVNIILLIRIILVTQSLSLRQNHLRPSLSLPPAILQPAYPHHLRRSPLLRYVISSLVTTPLTLSSLWKLSQTCIGLGFCLLSLLLRFPKFVLNVCSYLCYELA